MTSLAGALGTILSAAAADLTVAFNTTFTEVTLLAGSQMLEEAVIGIFIAAPSMASGSSSSFRQRWCSLVQFSLRQLEANWTIA